MWRCTFFSKTALSDRFMIAWRAIWNAFITWLGSICCIYDIYSLIIASLSYDEMTKLPLKHMLISLLLSPSPWVGRLMHLPIGLHQRTSAILSTLCAISKSPYNAMSNEPEKSVEISWIYLSHFCITALLHTSDTFLVCQHRSQTRQSTPFCAAFRQ